MSLTSLFSRSGRSRRSEAVGTWTYEEAFSRNKGLIEPAEQVLLREACVAIAGLGGVGGVHAATLARAGIGRFRLADPDVFEVANFNRQYAATLDTLGTNKATATAELIRQINPEAEIRVFTDGVHENNLEEFLAGVDLFIDGVDFFAVGLRRRLFQACRDRGIWALTAGPVGFGVAWILFDPSGMSAEEYFDFAGCRTYLEALVAFAVGLAPRSLHLSYLDPTSVDPFRQVAPSFAGACQLCAGVASVEATKLLVGRGPVRPAPWYHQFDAWRGKFVRGRLRFGNRGLLQRLKRALVLHRALRNRPELRELSEPFGPSDGPDGGQPLGRGACHRSAAELDER